MIDVIRPRSFTLSIPQADCIGFQKCSWEAQSLLRRETAQTLSDGWNKVRLPLLSLAHWGACTSMPKAASIKTDPTAEMWNLRHENALDNQLWLFFFLVDDIIAFRSARLCLKGPLSILQWWTWEPDMLSTNSTACGRWIPIYHLPCKRICRSSQQAEWNNLSLYMLVWPTALYQ